MIITHHPGVPIAVQSESMMLNLREVLVRVAFDIPDLGHSTYQDSLPIISCLIIWDGVGTYSNILKPGIILDVAWI